MAAPRKTLNLVSLNAGRKCGSPEAVAALVHHYELQLSQYWDVICLKESDGVHEMGKVHDKLTEDVNTVLGRHKYVRNYAGEGTTAMAFIINARIVPYIREIKWCERAGSLLIQSGSSQPVQIMMLHGYQHDMAEDLSLIHISEPTRPY